MLKLPNLLRPLRDLPRKIFMCSGVSCAVSNLLHTQTLLQFKLGVQEIIPGSLSYFHFVKETPIRRDCHFIDVFCT